MHTPGSMPQSELHGEDITDHIARCVKSEQSRLRLQFFLGAMGNTSQQKPKEQPHNRNILVTGQIFLDRVLSRLVSDCFRLHKTVEVVVEDLVPGQPQQLFIALKGSSAELQQLTRQMQDTCEAIAGCTFESLSKEESRKRREAPASANTLLGPSSRNVPTSLPGANLHTHMVWTRVLPAVPNFFAHGEDLPMLLDQKQTVISVTGHLFNSVGGWLAGWLAGNLELGI